MWTNQINWAGVTNELDCLQHIGFVTERSAYLGECGIVVGGIVVGLLLAVVLCQRRWLMIGLAVVGLGASGLATDYEVPGSWDALCPVSVSGVYLYNPVNGNWVCAGRGTKIQDNAGRVWIFDIAETVGYACQNPAAGLPPATGDWWSYDGGFDNDLPGAPSVYVSANGTNYSVWTTQDVQVVTNTLVVIATNAIQMTVILSNISDTSGSIYDVLTALESDNYRSVTRSYTEVPTGSCAALLAQLMDWAQHVKAGDDSLKVSQMGGAPWYIDFAVGAWSGVEVLLDPDSEVNANLDEDWMKSVTQSLAIIASGAPAITNVYTNVNEEVGIPATSSWASTGSGWSSTGSQFMADAESLKNTYDGGTGCVWDVCQGLLASSFTVSTIGTRSNLDMGTFDLDIAGETFSWPCQVKLGGQFEGVIVLIRWAVRAWVLAGAFWAALAIIREGIA